MPTVLTIFGLRVVVYFNDHAPAHVHVLGSNREAVFDLNCPQGPVRLRQNFGFSKNELVRIVLQVQNHVRELCRKWRQIHGDI
jgi:hypothetical protein